MKRALRVAWRLLHPPALLLCLLIPASLALLVYSFLALTPKSPVSWLAYLLSAYTLTALSLYAPRGIRYFKNENKLLLRWRTDSAWRIKVSLTVSLVMNTAYAALQLGLGLYHAGVWFYTLAAYYTLLALMRLYLFAYARKERKRDLKKELFRYRFCGFVLLLMNLVLAGMLFFILWQGRTFHHSEITVIALAAYTFLSLTLSILGLVRHRKDGATVPVAAKCVSLVSALVSMLTLQSAMLTAFGDANARFTLWINGIFGTVVALFVLGLAIYMIVSSTRELKKLSHIKENTDATK